MNKVKLSLALISGILGCLCFGAGDWLMIYADPTYSGELFWLTDGTAQIAPWRNTLAMILAFPGIIFYAYALFALTSFITETHAKKIYCALNVLGLTPWLALHLFYIFILALFAQMIAAGSSDALFIAETLYFNFKWIITASEIFMLLPFLYWFYLQLSTKTVFPRLFSLSNVLVIYLILFAVKSLMPVSAFRLGFTNGLMSESMVIFFTISFLGGYHYLKKDYFFH